MLMVLEVGVDVNTRGLSGEMFGLRATDDCKVTAKDGFFDG
jgi:hypothetical protein